MRGDRTRKSNKSNDLEKKRKREKRERMENGTERERKGEREWSKGEKEYNGTRAEEVNRENVAAAEKKTFFFFLAVNKYLIRHENGREGGWCQKLSFTGELYFGLRHICH